MDSNRKKMCQVLVEFLEIAIHNLLKIKQIYPDTVFVRKQKYGNVVYQTIHPQLKEYISKFMEAVYNFALEDQLAKIIICFFDKTYKIIQEKIVFDISPIKSCIDIDKFLLELEKTFRSYFMNMNFLNQHLTVENNSELKFAMQIYTTESSGITFMENLNNPDFPWMQVSQNYCRILESEMIPLEIEENYFINMQIYIEKIC